jgi:hypothetical protein
MYLPIYLHTARRYSPRWALASSTTSLHCSLFIFSFHPFTFIFFRLLSTSSSYLILGLHFLLLKYSLPFNILFGIALSSILSICPNYLILCDLINLTTSSPFSNVFISSLYCTVSAVLDHFWPPNVQCLANFNLLGYWWHHSICYTGLFTTLLVVVTIFLVTMSSGPLISCLGAVLGCLLSSECWQLTDWLTVINWLLAVEMYSLKRISRAGYRAPSLTVVSSVATIWLLRKLNS